MRDLVGIGALALVGACMLPDDGAASLDGKTMSASQRSQCEADGGFVDRRGMLGMEMCVYSYADAGKSCTDSGECEGKCITYDFDTADRGKAVVGQCQADSALFGCFAEVEDGKAPAALCVD